MDWEDTGHWTRASGEEFVVTLASVHLVQRYFSLPSQLFCVQPSELCSCVHVFMCVWMSYEHSTLTEWSVTRSLASVHSREQMKCALHFHWLLLLLLLLNFVPKLFHCSLPVKQKTFVQLIKWGHCRFHFLLQLLIPILISTLELFDHPPSTIQHAASTTARSKRLLPGQYR